MPINTATIPLSLYIHLPWCVRKCPYCDFNSHALQQSELPEKAYIDALLKDLEFDSKLVGRRPITSIFFGGGTPSLFSGAAIKRILVAVREQLNCTDDIEITLEANPGTVEHDRFEMYREAGVNRLSIGVQSFNAEQLKKLGRIHNTDEAIRAANTAKKAGFDNFNLDLMFGLPQQTIEEALTDLQQACQLQPTHISWYQLTLEPNTVFYAKPPRLPDDEILWQMQVAGQQLLTENKYEQYEISAYAQLDKQCRHNVNYWQFGDYLGIGAGAHGKITLADGSIIRTAKTRQPKDYLARTDSFLSEKKVVSLTELPFEFMLNALRLKQPVSLTMFEQRTGLSSNLLQIGLNKASQKGLIQCEDKRIIITDIGSRFIDDIIQCFLA
jgi:oxygen-independent coproporphyrinogen-3 oxidase